MHFGRILEGLWDGRVTSLPATDPHALCSLIQGFLPVPSLCLSQRGTGAEDALVLGDDCRLASDLPLGDVLAEELDLDVPDRSLVILLPEACLRDDAPAAEVSRIAGRVLAQAAALIAERRWLEIDDEITAIRSLATLYRNLEKTRLPRLLGLQPSAFRAAFEGEIHALFGWSVLAPAEADAGAPGAERRPPAPARPAPLPANEPRIDRARQIPKVIRLLPHQRIQDGV